MNSAKKWLFAKLANAPLAASLYLALFFVIIALTQLFSFEDYDKVFMNYGIISSELTAQLFAAVIVTLEVFAVPFVLGMQMPKRVRMLSQLSGWVTLIVWLIIGIWQSTTTLLVANTGLFGSRIVSPQGWWLVSYMVALLVLFWFVVFTGRSHLKRRQFHKK